MGAYLSAAFFSGAPLVGNPSGGDEERDRQQGEEWESGSEEEEEEENSLSEGDDGSFEDDVGDIQTLEARLIQAQLLLQVIQDLTVGPTALPKFRDPVAVEGRLHAQWQKEENFLRRMENGSIEANASRLASSNFPHLYALLCLLRSPFIHDVCDVLSPMESMRHPPPFNSAGGKGPFIKQARREKLQRMNVDLVCSAGRLWVSIIARKGEQMNWRRESAECKSGLKDKVTSLLEASSNEKFPPLLLLCVPLDVPLEVTDRMRTKWNATQIEGVTWPCDGRLAAASSSLGRDILERDAFLPYEASYWLIVPPHYPLPQYLVSKYHLPFLDSRMEYVNLDTSTLMAITTDMTNGKAKALQAYIQRGQDPTRRRISEFVAAQVDEEVEESLMPFLQSAILNRKLIVTREAKEHFLHILLKIGSASEKVRGCDLLERTRVFEEIDWEAEMGCPLFHNDHLKTDRIIVLPASKTMKELPRVVFGRGDAIPSIATATSNHSVVRAAREQGVFLQVILHPPRSLMTNRLEFL